MVLTLRGGTRGQGIIGRSVLDRRGGVVRPPSSPPQGGGPTPPPPFQFWGGPTRLRKKFWALRAGNFLTCFFMCKIFFIAQVVVLMLQGCKKNCCFCVRSDESLGKPSPLARGNFFLWRFAPKSSQHILLISQWLRRFAPKEIFSKAAPSQCSLF